MVGDTGEPFVLEIKRLPFRTMAFRRFEIIGEFSVFPASPAAVLCGNSDTECVCFMEICWVVPLAPTLSRSRGPDLA